MVVRIHLILDLCDVFAEQLAVSRLVAAEAVAVECRLQLRGIGGECRGLHVVGEHRVPLVHHAGEEEDRHEDHEEYGGKEVVKVGVVFLAFHIALESKHEQQQDEQMDFGGGLQQVVLHEPVRHRVDVRAEEGEAGRDASAHLQADGE